MSETLRLRGCIPIVATPFHEDGSIDETSLKAQVEWLIAGGVHGLATPAIASEGYKLSDEEREIVVAIVVATARERVPVVVSADGGGTDIAIDRAVSAAILGADALMVLPPHFIKPDAENLARYYARIAATVPIPIMVQDAPQLTGVTLPAGLLARIHADHPKVNSVKIEGTPAGGKTSEVLALTGGGMDVFAGWGGLSFWDGLLRGAAGCMPAANFGPALARVYDLFVHGERAAAYTAFNAAVPFIAWSMQSIDLSVWTAKEALTRAGVLASATLREPATLPDAILRGEFDAFYSSAGCKIKKSN
ncbi:MAG: dihydrodipicolinate synthase family protein [Anaerolineae bacterium]